NLKRFIQIVHISYLFVSSAKIILSKSFKGLSFLKLFFSSVTLNNMVVILAQLITMHCSIHKYIYQLKQLLSTSCLGSLALPLITSALTLNATAA
ncbi:hypothetical protein, partial [Streptomyces syringium]